MSISDIGNRQVYGASIAFLKRTAPEVHTFWSEGGKVDWNPASYLAHSDYIYCRTLLGDASELSSESAELFANAIKNAPLAGRAGYDKQLLPHLSAYMLGALNLLAQSGYDFRDEVLAHIELDIYSLIDPDTLLPRWPHLWSHHIWRVSHWIGGIPSILLTFARHDPKRRVSEEFATSILESCDKHVINNKGLLRPYNSDVLQAFFRTLYRLRHDPNLAEIGGLVHLHWVNYVAGRKYINNKQLINRCIRDMNRQPFLEEMPYCLDFDYMQLLRTSIEQNPEMKTDAVLKRASQYIESITWFLNAIPRSGYTLHKLTGTLATLHEASMLLKIEFVPSINVKPIDIIGKAYWL